MNNAALVYFAFTKAPIPPQGKEPGEGMGAVSKLANGRPAAAVKSAVLGNQIAGVSRGQTGLRLANHRTAYMPAIGVG